VYISEALIKEIVIPYRYRVSKLRREALDVPLFKVLDNLMPVVSLGRYEIEFLSQDTFTIHIYEY
jgi:hypothetical protein